MTDHAMSNAKSWLESIVEMMVNLRLAENAGDGDATEACRNAIEESPLSIQVRFGWTNPGADMSDEKPEEYLILLSTGGPALRIVGELGEHGTPSSARLEYQDWGTPWTEYHDSTVEQDADVLAFAQTFYWGE